MFINYRYFYFKINVSLNLKQNLSDYWNFIFSAQSLLISLYVYTRCDKKITAIFKLRELRMFAW